MKHLPPMFSRVTALREIAGVPAGKEGTLVALYADGLGAEVEFYVGDAIVVATAEAPDIEMTENMTTAQVPLVVTEAMDLAAFEAAGSPSEWPGLQVIWTAALQAAEKLRALKRAREWPFGEDGPSPLHVSCPACGAIAGEPCVTAFKGASHNARFRAADKMTKKPDDLGVFHPRCQHIIQKPRGEDGPVQCRRAAHRGERFCDYHLNLHVGADDAST